MLQSLFARMYFADPIAVGGGEGEGSGGGTPKKTDLTCEFCECRLTGSGDYLTLSEKAKKMRKSSETIETLEATNATLRTEKEELQRRLDALTTTSDSAKTLRFHLKGNK